MTTTATTSATSALLRVATTGRSRENRKKIFSSSSFSSRYRPPRRCPRRFLGINITANTNGIERGEEGDEEEQGEKETEEERQIARILSSSSSPSSSHISASEEKMTRERFRGIIEAHVADFFSTDDGTLLNSTTNNNDSSSKGTMINAIDIAVYLVEKKLVKSVEEGLLLVAEEDVVMASLLRVKNAEKRWSDVIAADAWKKEQKTNGGLGERRREQQHVKNARCETGQICFTVQDAREMLEKGKGGGSQAAKVILCCECVDSSLLETDEERRFAEDEESVVDVLQDVAGVIFLKDDKFGAELSKKEFGLACVSGTNDGDDGNEIGFSIEIDKKSRKFAKFTTTTFSNSNNNNNNKKQSTTILHTGDYVTIDGRNGVVYRGAVELVPPVKSERNKLFFEWLAQKSKFLNAIRIFAECDSADAIDEYVDENNNRDGSSIGGGDASNFIGVGLVKVENVLKKYRGGDARQAVHMLLCAETKDERCEALAMLSPHLRYDFEDMFKASFQPDQKNEENSRVIVRLLDEPLHAFLPDSENLNDLVPLLAVDSGKDERDVVEIIEQNLLDEVNPDFGFRGCRVGALYPEITKEQVRAILGAAYGVKEFFTFAAEPPIVDICVPNIASAEEFEHQLNIIRNVADEFSYMEEKTNSKIAYRVGAMLETPRSCLIAGDLARMGAEFLIVGLDELTETTYGVSLEDSHKFFPRYLYGGEDMDINGSEFDFDEDDDDEENDAKDIAREEQEEEENAIIWNFNPFIAWDDKGVGRLVQSAINEAREVNPNIDVVACGQMCGHRGADFIYRKFQDLRVNGVSVDPRFIAVARLRALQAIIANTHTTTNNSSS